MSGLTYPEGARSGRKAWVALCALLVIAALALIGSADRAAAQEFNFCTNSWLQPFGQNGDRCDAGQGSWGHLETVKIQTYERAGCVNYHGWYGEYYRSWACFGNYNAGIIYPQHDGGSYIPIIRNNNLSVAGKFSGGYACCWP